MLRKALFEMDGPVAVRYPRGGEGQFRKDTSDEPMVCLRSGTDVTLLGYGIMVNHLLDAAEMLEKEGIQAEVWKLNQISPLDHSVICDRLANRTTMLVLEDSFGAGCVGQRVAGILAEHACAPRHLILKNLGKTFAPEGSVSQLEENFGLDAAGVVKAVLEAIKHGE